jgi:hypothetical protein
MDGCLVTKGPSSRGRTESSGFSARLCPFPASRDHSQPQAFLKLNFLEGATQELHLPWLLACVSAQQIFLNKYFFLPLRQGLAV